MSTLPPSGEGTRKKLTRVPSAPGRFSGKTGVTLNLDRKSTRLNSSHLVISYAVFCLKKKKKNRAIAVLEREVLVLDPIRLLDRGKRIGIAADADQVRIEALQILLEHHGRVALRMSQ